jgi:hypothetical protein
LRSTYNDNVFINCPFDDGYKPIFYALIFALHEVGFVARSALEISNATQNRFAKILRIIGECRYGIHDISRTELDATFSLPRFNMPLELGVFFGCRWFGDKTHRSKSCLILDKEPYRYQKFISDIAGQDIYSHNNRPEEAITVVRNWLTTESKRVLPGKAVIWRRYNQFQQTIPTTCQGLNIEVNELTLSDYIIIVIDWLSANPL